MTLCIVISGCSGGGKSTLIEALAARGENVIAEPGRRIVAEELAGDGSALPWVDASAFARRALATARADLRSVDRTLHRVFLDRGLIDAAVALEQATGLPASTTLAHDNRLYSTVFLAPPWPEIYVSDTQRPHGFDDAVAEFHRLDRAFPLLGYDVEYLPKASLEQRVDFILDRLDPAN